MRLTPTLILAHAQRPKTLIQAPEAKGRAGRRRWTQEDLSALVEALATLRTSDIAQAIGVNPKALRSLLRRNGISLRGIREQIGKKEFGPGLGLLLRRSASTPSATFGAAALASLPESSCRWPSGDPANPGFSFCSERRLRRHSYCSRHLEAARLKSEENHAV
jgi:GcrA cell cycle regulator